MAGKEEGMNEETQNDRAARRANAVDIWDRLWSEEGEDSWRKEAMNRTYVRICRILGESDGDGPGATVTDLGGGAGFLSKKLAARGFVPLVVDHSSAAISACHEAGISAMPHDLVLEPSDWTIAPGGVVVATEVIEHFPEDVRSKILERAHKYSRMAFFSVPNNRLGPDEEPQHTIKWTAIEFKRYLESFWGEGHVRVEVLGPYLLGVCSKEKKQFSLSVCFPARDEEEDIEATLASFMGVADQMVIGIDPRSEDQTWEIAEQYADVVFELEDPQGLSTDDPAPDGGVHFAHIRNQCADRCDGDWIFMTEAHERLISGEDTLLHLSYLIPDQARVGFVFRNGGHDPSRRERWAFPWLYRNDGVCKFKRNTHNVLDYPYGTYVVRVPQINTLHERHRDREVARQAQRKAQNRLTLLDDWRTNDNANSLFYLAQELRGIGSMSDEKALHRFIQFLATNNGNGEARYQSRLMMAKLYLRIGSETGDEDKIRESRKDARAVLMGATSDDWSRVEHWIWLGDLASLDEKWEEAHQFYLYAASRISNPPFTLWWIDMAMYSYIPAQRLAVACSELGRVHNSLEWAKRVLELLPDNAPAGAFEEAERNIELLKGALEP